MCRGKESCGDIDILMTNEHGGCNIMLELVSRLTAAGVITDDLSAMHDSDSINQVAGHVPTSPKY